MPAHRADTAKFCSHLCQNKLQYRDKTHQKTCAGCAATFTVSDSRSRKRYCKAECRSHVTVRERRQQAKLITLASRGHNSGRLTRKVAFANKPASCEICGYDKHRYCLDVHHIDNNPQNNVVENLAVLCALCHRQVHKGDAVYPNATQKQAVAVALSQAGKAKKKEKKGE